MGISRLLCACCELIFGHLRCRHDLVLPTRLGQHMRRYPLFKTERLFPYCIPSACKSHYPTRPAYLRGPIHRWRRTRPSVRPVRCLPPRIAHGDPASPSPFPRQIDELTKRVASLCTSLGCLDQELVLLSHRRRAVLPVKTRRPDKTGRTSTCDLVLFSFRTGGLLPARLHLHNLCFRWPRERQQKSAVLGGLHIVRNALIQYEQVSWKEIHHPLGQVKFDMK